MVGLSLQPRPTGKARWLSRHIPRRLVTCPAALYVEETALGTAVRCRVTRSSVTAQRDPSSLAAYCMGDYTACPVWQKDKERAWAQRKQPLVPEEQDKLPG